MQENPRGCIPPSVTRNHGKSAPSVMGLERQAPIPLHERPRSPNPTRLSRCRPQGGAAFMPGAALSFGPEPTVARFAGATARVWRRRTLQPSAGSMQVRFRSRPRLLVPGKVHVASAAGLLPSVRGRLVGRLHHAWSNSVPERQSAGRTRTRQRGSATRRGTTSSGTASRQGDVRGRAASQEADPAPSLFVKGCGSGAAMLMPDRATPSARG